MKRILGVLISSVMLAVTCLTALPVSAKEEYTEYIVPFYSDQTKQRQVLGISNKSLLKDGVVLIPLETACEIAGASIAAENDEAVVITRNYVSWCCEYEDEKHQYLLIDSHTGEGNYFESILKEVPDGPEHWESGTNLISGLHHNFEYVDDGWVHFDVVEVYLTSVDYAYHNDKLYVSFYDFLIMMGVDVDLINHEAINEITEFYTSMVEQYSTEEDYKTAVSEIDKLFSAGTGYEQFFYCTLGTPIDELYKAYYDSDLMCDLGDYYGDGSVEWANLVNAVENYDGLTKTALAALNLNTDYEDVLINIVTYHGDSEEDNFAKTVEDSTDIIQRLMYVRDFGLSVEDLYAADSALETVWRMQEKSDVIEPILTNADNLDLDSSFSPDVISMIYSGLCGAMNNYAKYREISNLFEGEQYLIKNTILSSDAMASNTTDEARGMFISHILNPMGNVIEMHSNLRNEENSYFNLYHSAAKVQETMNASSPAAWAAVWGAISDAALSTGDDLIMGVIDYTFFGGLPVSSLVNSGILFCVDGLKNTAYGKEQSQIAELDDYVFLQEVAEDCFKEHSLTSENAYSSFILGLKATMLAYKTNGEDSSWDPNYKDSDSVKAYKEMNLMLNTSLSNSVNTDFYNVFPKSCDDLTEMLGNNTDIFKLDPTPHLGITLEYAEKTTEPTETPSESETIDYEEIYYSYIKNELVPQYGLSDLAGFEAINWKGSPVVNEIPSITQGIIGAKIYDYNGDGYKECLVIRQNQYDYIIDCYDHDLNLLDSYTACSFTPGSPGYDVSLKISMLNDYIVIENSSMSVPSLSNYGTNVAILSLSDGKLIETLKFGGFRWATGGETLYINDESIGDTTLTESDAESMKNKISSALQSLGISFDTLEVGWINDSYGVEIEFTDEPMLLFKEAFSDNLTYFKDYTNLRDHITAPVTPAITNISGRYSNDNLFVDVTGEIGSEGKIRVEYVDSVRIRSIVNYQGKLSEQMSFDADDRFGTNSYNIVFRNGEIEITIHGKECKNELEGWLIPDINQTLKLTTKEVPNYDISSWTDEMIIKAINNYLKQSNDWKQYAVFTSDIYDTRATVRFQGGMEANTLTDYLVGWGYNEDFAYIALQDSGILYDEFHLTEYLNADVSEPEQTITWQQLYADELRNFMNSDSYSTDSMFDLHDINSDSIPEQFISEGAPHMRQVQVYTIHDGKLIFLGDYGEYGYVSYNPEQSLMWSGYFSQGYGYESHYRLENGTLVEVFSCETNSAAVMDESEAYYMINGENVSKSEFETKREENTFDGWVSVGRKHPLDESTINSVLLSSGTRMGTIITENDSLNVRQSPSTESSKIGTIDKGSMVNILSESNGWYEIEFNGKSGYILGEYVQIFE